jgi:hypothetical protein
MSPDEKTVFASRRGRFGKKTPYYVWSSAVKEVALKMGYSNIRVVASPWCYLPRLTRVKNSSPRFLIMPGHITISDMLRRKYLFAKQAAEFKKVVGNNEAVVLLYWLDFLDNDIRKSYELQGFEVTTNGYPGTQNLDTLYSSSRIHFLFNLQQIMNSFDVLITNAYASPLFYAIDMGLNVRLVSDHLSDAIENPYAFTKDIYLNNKISGLKLVLEIAPEILSDFARPNNSSELLNITIGRGNELDPAQLRSTLELDLDFFKETLSFESNERLNY